MTQVICAVVAAFSTIICAWIAKKDKVRAEKSDARAELRRRESMLSLKLSYATCELSTVCANALTNGHNNGNVEKAKAAAEKAASEYLQFMEEVTAHECTK